jgi:hypothetical protein
MVGAAGHLVIPCAAQVVLLPQALPHPSLLLPRPSQPLLEQVLGCSSGHLLAESASSPLAYYVSKPWCWAEGLPSLYRIPRKAKL